MGELVELPERMFAVGHEPVGTRVTSYGHSSGISAILDVLEEREREAIRRSTFGKFIAINEKPSYSVTFGRLLLSRQLKVNKKHEIWFIFAGKPIRFSLREFAIVTGLPSGEFPKRSKRKLHDNIVEIPYWSSLFGKLENVTVCEVIKMLKRKIVTDEETRIKYACLALLASVLMPTTHHMKIVKEHVERIKDLASFFTYPWGRLAFCMLINSIKSKNEITLSQNSIAIKGFVHALQLVIVEAVPTLLEVVQLSTLSESEDDEGEDGPEVSRISLISPSHMRFLINDPTTVVDSIISDDGETEVDEEELVWSDEVEDPKVDNLVGLINKEHNFSCSMFFGGATRNDVLQMIKDDKEKNAKLKKKKVISTLNTVLEEGISIDTHLHTEGDAGNIADIVAGKVLVEIKKLEGRVDQCVKKLEELMSAIKVLEVDISAHLSGELEKMKVELVNSLTTLLDKSVCIPDNNNVAGGRSVSNTLKRKQVHTNMMS